MCFDSHTIRQQIAFCPHTQDMKGNAKEAFNIDVILKQVKKDLDDQNTDDDKKPLSTIEEGPELGKHYMAFWFQTWTSKRRPITFMVARYCLNGLSARWLVVEIRKSIATLAFYGFVANALGFDGATENRSAICH